MCWVNADLSVQIDVVTCQLNGRVYVRKSVEKHFAQRTREVTLVLPSKAFFILRNSAAMLSTVGTGYSSARET
jgi:hypothetical protein